MSKSDGTSRAKLLRIVEAAKKAWPPERALNDIPVPRRYAELFTEIPEHRFRLDTSSSEIRARARSRDVPSAIHKQ